MASKLNGEIAAGLEPITARGSSRSFWEKTGIAKRHHCG
jgi:hypothetical protein